MEGNKPSKLKRVGEWAKNHKAEIGVGIATTVAATTAALISYPPKSEALYYIERAANTAQSLYPWWFTPHNLANTFRDAIPVLETPVASQVTYGLGGAGVTYAIKKIGKKVKNFVYNRD